MRVVFAGTPHFAVPALEALVDAGHLVCAVYTRPDRPAGRGRQLTASPVKQAAQKLGIPIEEPESLRDESATQRLKDHLPEAMVVAAYGLILPAAILRVPVHGCINIHASLLPRWRGAAPIQRAILAADALTGVSIMLMEPGLDTGPVYARVTTPIADSDTAGSLHGRLAGLGAQAIVQTLDQIARNQAHTEVQDARLATYAHKVDKSEALIDWTRPAQDIERKVRAFNPWPIAETRWQQLQLRIWSARPLDMAAGAQPGTVVAAGAEGVVVACGEGALAIETLQLPGGRPTSAVAFLNSHDLRDVRLG